MAHNEEYDNHTRKIEFEKKRRARELLNEQVKENNMKRAREEEEQK